MVKLKFGNSLVSGGVVDQSISLDLCKENKFEQGWRDFTEIGIIRVKAINDKFIRVKFIKLKNFR